VVEVVQVLVLVLVGEEQLRGERGPVRKMMVRVGIWTSIEGQRPGTSAARPQPDNVNTTLTLTHADCLGGGLFLSLP
jgi:hypothetical protein